jgi:CubicO group peptidase (beta-lactamase class C family)
MDDPKIHQDTRRLCLGRKLLQNRCFHLMVLSYERRAVAMSLGGWYEKFWMSGSSDGMCIMTNRVTVLSALMIFTCFGYVSPQETGKRAGYEGQDDDTLQEKVDRVFAAWDKPDSPGCALAVIKDGRIVYSRGYGMAKLDSQVPITPATVFDIGSMSKQFTAAAVVLLAESGKLSLNDDIRKYFPEFPDYGNTITIRHLLWHTSGIRDYAWLMLLARMSFEGTDKDDRQEILHLLARQRHLYFVPGGDSYYSNSNYLLLGLIVERAAGMPLGEYEEKHIFEPLGMRHTFLRTVRDARIEHAADGYVRDDPGTYRVKNDLVPPGPGGLHSTVEDLFLWDRSFHDRKIGGPDFNTTMVTPGRLNNGNLTMFACGLEVGEHGGLKTVGHKGFTEGFDTYLIRFPEQEFSVICLANLEIHSSTLAMKVADLYLAGQLKPVASAQPQREPVQRTEVSLDPSVLDIYTGPYRFDFGLLVNIKKENNRLMMEADKQPTVELFPESDTQFFMKVVDAQISFQRDENGKITGLTLHQMGQNMPAKRMGLDEALPPERLSEFVGQYYNDELQVTYTVVSNEGRLSVTAPRAFESQLRYIQGDAFAMSRGDIVFQRNDLGEIAAFVLDVKAERLNFRFRRK